MVSQLKAGWLGDHVIGCQVIVGRGCEETSILEVQSTPSCLAK